MSIVLDYRNKLAHEALNHFQKIIEEADDFEEVIEYIIETNSYDVQGAILEIIDSLDLNHRITLGGKIYVYFNG